MQARVGAAGPDFAPTGQCPHLAFIREESALDAQAADVPSRRQTLQPHLDPPLAQHLGGHAPPVLEVLPDLFLWIDRGGRIVGAQAGDTRDPHLASAGLVGQSVEACPTPDVGARFAIAVGDAQASGASGAFQYEVLHGEHPSFYEARLLPLDDGLVFAAIRNVTDTHRVEAAESANRAKGEFLAHMSHELRTPLHGILSFARFGRQRADAGDIAKLIHYFTVIERSGGALLRILDELLDMAKLDAGMMRFELQPVDLGPMLATEVESFRSSLTERGVTLELDTPPTRIVVNGDEHRLAQVIRNLLSNAVKFSPAGGALRITATCFGDAARLSFQDEGPGIPEGELETVFDRFVQSSRMVSGASGTGLGLAICRQIVDAHAGRIWAEHADPGTRVIVELPALDAGALDAPISCAA